MASKEKKQRSDESLAKELRGKACMAIDKLSDELHELSNKLWSNPELKFEEHFAHDTVTTFLEKHGFEVRKKYPLETAFMASNKTTKQGNGPCVAILCEYDALPQIGHACGHNLIAEAGVAAAIGTKLSSYPRIKNFRINNFDMSKGRNPFVGNFRSSGLALER